MRSFGLPTRGGIYWQKGMAGFGDKITKSEADAIHHYLIKRGHEHHDALHEENKSRQEVFRFSESRRSWVPASIR